MYKVAIRFTLIMCLPVDCGQIYLVIYNRVSNVQRYLNRHSNVKHIVQLYYLCNIGLFNRYMFRLHVIIPSFKLNFEMVPPL